LHRTWTVEYIPFPKRPQTLPVVLSRDEVQRVIRAPRHIKHRVILAPLSTTGLRVSELARLQGTDIDSGRMVVVVRQGKGKKDRQGGLSTDLLPLLRRYWKL
jgi:integrase